MKILTEVTENDVLQKGLAFHKKLLRNEYMTVFKDLYCSNNYFTFSTMQKGGMEKLFKFEVHTSYIMMKLNDYN